MKQNDAVRAMLKVTGRTQEYLGSQLDPVLSQSSVGNMLTRNNMTVNRLWEICNILGYEIVLRPAKKGAANKDNTFVIDAQTKAERSEHLQATRYHKEA